MRVLVGRERGQENVSILAKLNGLQKRSRGLRYDAQSSLLQQRSFMRSAANGQPDYSDAAMWAQHGISEGKAAGESRLIYCYPAFLKLRWRGGKPLDAKAYFIAGAQRR